MFRNVYLFEQSIKVLNESVKICKRQVKKNDKWIDLECKASSKVNGFLYAPWVAERIKLWKMWYFKCYFH